MIYRVKVDSTFNEKDLKSALLALSQHFKSLAFNKPSKLPINKDTEITVSAPKLKITVKPEKKRTITQIMKDINDKYPDDYI